MLSVCWTTAWHLRINITQRPNAHAYASQIYTQRPPLPLHSRHADDDLHSEVSLPLRSDLIICLVSGFMSYDSTCLLNTNVRSPCLRTHIDQARIYNDAFDRPTFMSLEKRIFCSNFRSRWAYHAKKFIVVHPAKIFILKHGTPHFWKLSTIHSIVSRGCGYCSSILDFMELYLRRNLEHNIKSSLPSQLF